MQEPEDIVGEALWNRMTVTYRGWIRTDRYGTTAAMNSGHETYSVRQLLGPIYAVGGHKRLLHCKGGRSEFKMGMTMRQLTEMDIRQADGSLLQLDHLFFQNLCVQMFDSLLSEVKSYLDTTEADEERSAILKGASCHTWESLLELCTSPANARFLIERLYRIWVHETADAKLWEFFQMRHQNDGYRTWYPGACGVFGHLMAPREIRSKSADVVIEVSRYMDDTGTTIRPFEWEAQLRIDSTSEFPDAIACGMVYVMGREGEEPAPPNQLLKAVASLADHDAEQVLAFFGQYHHAEKLAARGDLCFLWLWERREGSARGLGVEVLEVALRDLKDRFPRLKTLVVNIKPSQFRDAAADNDPSEVQVARFEACERLEKLLNSLHVAERFNLDLRMVASRPLVPETVVKSLGIMVNGRA